jgi:hypothetical protein
LIFLLASGFWLRLFFWLLASGFWLVFSSGFWLVFSSGFWLVFSSGFWLVFSSLPESVPPIDPASNSAILPAKRCHRAEADVKICQLIES